MSLVKKTPDAVTLRVDCPACNRGVDVTITVAIVDNASHYPVSHAHLHGSPPHVLTVYIDRQYHVRGTEVSETVTVEREQGMPLSAMVLLRVPPRLKQTAMAMLKLRQANPAEIATITGKTLNAESQYLGMMFRMGYLERTRLKRFYQYRIPGALT